MPHLQTAKHRCFSRVLMKPLFPCAKPTALLRTARTFVAQSRPAFSARTTGAMLFQSTPAATNHAQHKPAQEQPTPYSKQP